VVSERSLFALAALLAMTGAAKVTRRRVHA
jgi:hypothetical protein